MFANFSGLRSQQIRRDNRASISDYVAPMEERAPVLPPPLQIPEHCTEAKSKFHRHMHMHMYKHMHMHVHAHAQAQLPTLDRIEESKEVFF